MITELSKKKRLEYYKNHKKETDFMEELLEPLFSHMPYEKVSYNHGANEYGKDFYLIKKMEIIGYEAIAVVVKNGDISGSTGGKKSLADALVQVDQAWNMKINDHAFGGSLKVNKVFVCASGKITHNAKNQILEMVTERNSIHGGRNTHFLDSEDLVPLISNYYPNFFETNVPYISEYLDSLLAHVESFTKVDSSQLELIGEFEVMCKKSNPDAESKKEKKYPSLLIEKGMEVWLQGGTGSGKTYSVIKIIDRLQDKITTFESIDDLNSSPLKVPMYISYRYNEEIDSRDIKRSLKEYIIDKYNFKNIDTLFDVWLKNGKIVFFIDEIEKGDSEKDKVNEVINFIKNENPENQIVLLSRKMVSGDKLGSYDIWDMCEISVSNSIKLIRSTLHENQEVQDKFDDLVKNGSIQQVSRTPLAVNVLSKVFNSKVKNTPVNAFEFFDMFFEIVLGRWEAERTTDDILDYNQTRPLLQRIAYLMNENNLVEIEVKSLLPLADELLKSINEKEVSPKGLIHKLTSYTDLVRVRGTLFSFRYTTYQEFLAGCEIKDHHYSHDFILENFCSFCWEESILFALGGKRRDNEFLVKVGNIKTENLQQKLLKIKNISLSIQALYQSMPNSKKVALAEGLRIAQATSDEEDYKTYINDILNIKNKEDFKYNLLPYFSMLNIFAGYYSRKYLEDLLVTSLSSSDERSKYYLIATISLINLNSENKEKLNDILKNVDFNKEDVEYYAIGPYLDFVSGGNITENKLLTVKNILKSKKIKLVQQNTDKFIINERTKGRKF